MNEIIIEFDAFEWCGKCQKAVMHHYTYPNPDKEVLRNTQIKCKRCGIVNYTELKNFSFNDGHYNAIIK